MPSSALNCTIGGDQASPNIANQIGITGLMHRCFTLQQRCPRAFESNLPVDFNAIGPPAWLPTGQHTRNRNQTLRSGGQQHRWPRGTFRKEYKSVSSPTIEPGLFRDVLGSYPTGVCVITALDDDKQPAGMVVGTFTSVSLDPPLVGFLPDKSSTSWPKIEKAGRFCVNVLGSNQQQACRQIAGKGDKFAGLDLVISDNGLPVMADALASIECTIQSVTEAGDHWFVVGSVLRLETARDDDPMVFHRGRYGGFGEII